MNPITTTADYASRQSDRWLFIAALVLLIVAAVGVWRWVMADREKLANRLTAMTDRHIESQEKVVEVVVNNTAAINEVKEAVREVKDVMANCRFKNTNS